LRALTPKQRAVCARTASRSSHGAIQPFRRNRLLCWCGRQARELVHVHALRAVQAQHVFRLMLPTSTFPDTMPDTPWCAAYTGNCWGGDVNMRRVVTGRTADGKSVFVSDQQVEPITIRLAPGLEFYAV
jgi:hypothetical protein